MVMHPGKVTLFGPGDEAYDDATSPHNASGAQRPAFVARAGSSDDVVAVVREAAARGLRVLPQATGHGAGGVVDDDVLLLDTSGLTDLSVDADARTARGGAGLTWGEVNREAERHGLLGLAGSSPSVSISGYTFGGGVGWLCRPHGMASAALRSVEYVDGHGVARRAADDAAEETDREAMYAFRGGGGVGIATSLEFGLFPVPDLHAGYLLWPVAALDVIVQAWSAAMPRLGPDVATSIAVLHVPPEAPPFPERLRGTTVVHLALAGGRGPDGARPLLQAVREAGGAPAVDTWGPADAARLAQIHLDPPAATPALGEGRWLTDAAPARAAEILSSAVAEDSRIVMLEIRSVGNDAEGRPGAATRVAGPYVVHAVAPLTAPDARPAIERSLHALREMIAPVDAGLSLGSWAEGATSVPDALPDDVRSRVVAAADRVDPERTIQRSRFLV